MRIAALLVALVVVVVGIVGIVSPESVTTVRRQYFATPSGLYVAGAVRVAMGLVLILAASVSRAPKILRTLGAVMCAQGLAATLLGLDRAQAILERETMYPVLLRAGAMVAVAGGSFIALAVAKSNEGR
jgi:ribose/xylose/arabinose/galactoside ABC-type transport system permease subunit